MEKDGKKALIIVGTGCGIAVLAFALTRKAEAAPPLNILLSNLTIQPSAVYIKNPVSISVLAINIGETAGSYEVTCEVV